MCGRGDGESAYARDSWGVRGDRGERLLEWRLSDWDPATASAERLDLSEDLRDLDLRPLDEEISAAGRRVDEDLS